MINLKQDFDEEYCGYKEHLLSLGHPEKGFAFGYDWALYDVRCSLDEAGVKYK